MKLKRLLSLCLALVLTLGMLSPAVVAEAAAMKPKDDLVAAPMKFEDYTEPTITDPEDYRVYHSVSTGDMIWGQTYGLDTPEAIDEYLDVLQDMGFSRIYWRGLQMAVMANQLTVRPEANIRMMHQGINYNANYSENSNFGGLTIDQYLVQEAHKRGMEVIGQTTMTDFGAPGDSTLTNYPYAHYSYHMEHPEWSPVDQWGLMKQGGAVEFSYEEARKYIIDLTMEEVKKVGYDGVMFYSHTENLDLKYEDQFGYNEPAVEEFKRRYGITPEQDNLHYRVSLEHWRMLRGEYVTSFLREMKEALVEYNPDAIIALNVSSSKPRQPEVYGNYFDSMITNNFYMDYETYVQENIVDELHVKGNTDFPKHIKMIEDMLWLCRGTDTEVVIVTSAVNLKSVNLYDYWTPYMQRGVAVEYFTCEDDTIYRYGPDISDKIDSMSEASQLRYHVAQVAIGKEQATLAQLEEWLQHDSVAVPRLAMLALVRYHRNNAAPLLEEALKNEEITVRGFALKLIVENRLTTPTMAATILETVDLDNAFSTFEFSAEALALMNTSQRAVLWNAFTDPDTSLRAKICAIQGLNGTAMSEENVAVLHEVITGDAFATEYDDIYDADSQKALEASYKNYIRWYSVANMYHAGRLGSAAARQHLIDYVTSDDTVAASIAIDLVGSAGQFFTAEENEKAVAALDTVFARLSSKSGYTYDGDFKQWAYRPAGDSLVKLGDAGKAVLEKYYTGKDKKLAVDAFKCLYMPQSAKTLTLLTYDEYKEVYEHLPAALNSYKDVKLEQDFEDTSVFNAGSNPASPAWNGDQNKIGGRWQWGGSMAKITAANARSGNQSLMLSGDMPAYTAGSAGWNQTISDDGKDYRVSLWICHEGGKFNMNTAVSGAGNDYNDPKVAEVFVQILDDGNVMVYDKPNGAFAETGLTVPKNKWTQITIEAFRSGDANQATVSVRPEGEATSTSELFTIVPQPEGTMTLRMTHQATNDVTYVDDVLWLLSAVDTSAVNEKVITLDSDSVTYNGEPHGLTAVTEPSGLHVEYTYKDSDGNTLDEKPVNVGVYTVTAAVTDDGYHGASAAATLEIRRANTVVTGTATATPVKLGHPLSESVLDTEGLVVTPYGGTESLAGTYAWENPGAYCTASEMQTFIFTPDDPNYKPGKGSVMVYVTGDTYQTITVLDQDFEDTDLFKADATETYTAGSADTVGGYWYNLQPHERENGASIYDVKNINGVGQAAQLKRGTSGITPESIRLYGSVNKGVASNEDFTLTIRAYRENNQTMIMDFATHYIYIKPDGAIAVHKADGVNWQDTGVNLGVGNWTDVIIKSDRVTGTFSVAVQPVGGSLTTGTATGILKNVGIAGLNMYATSNGTVSPYIDSIRLDKMVPVMVGEDTVVETDVLNQNFDDTERFKADVTGAYTAGSKDTVGGYWYNLQPNNRENGGSIYKMETVGGIGQVVQMKRGTTGVTYDSIRLYGSVNNGVADNEDFTLTIRAYRADDAQTMLIDLGIDSIYIQPGGTVAVHKADGASWQATGVSLPLNTWTDLIIKSNRSEGTFTVFMQPVDGDLVEGTLANGIILKDVALNGINMYATSNGTVSPYIDSICLNKLVPAGDGDEVDEITVLAQDFEDTELFKAGIENAYTAGSADTVGGYWNNLHPHGRENGGSIYDVNNINGVGQAVQLKRNSSDPVAIWLNGSVNNGVADNEDFTLTVRAYRENDAQTMLIDLGIDMIYIQPGGTIAVHKADGASWQSTGVSLPLSTWTDVIIKSNRSEGTFTVFVKPVDGDLVEGTLAKGIILKKVGIKVIKMCATSNGTVSPYIDSVVLTKSEVVGVSADYLVALNPVARAIVGGTVDVQLNVISTTKATYNSFRYELSYDADILTYAGATNGVTVDSTTPGKLIVTGSGERAVSDIIELSFTAKQGGTFHVTLDKAYVEETEALVTVGTTEITFTGNTVTLPEDFEGAAAVEDGADYTFTAKNPNYNYTFNATMGGVPVQVIDNGNCTFTVKNVTDDLVIDVQKTPKSFEVSVEGNAKDDVAAANMATHATDYRFTVNMDPDYTYHVNVLVNGKTYTPEKDGSIYTIAGLDIVGDIVITVNKTIIPNAPVIEGVADGGIYCGQQLVTINDPDGDITEVYLDGSCTTLQDGKLVVFPRSSLLDRTIQVIDARGTTTTVSFKVYADHSYPEEGTVTKAPSLTEPGEETFVCENGCGIDKVLPIDKLVFSIYGANMTLGNDLSMSFFIEKSKVPAGAYAKITFKGETMDLPMEKWEETSSKDGSVAYWKLVYNGIAAKEMTDAFTVQIFAADGTPVTEVWTDSIQDYAQRMLNREDSTAELKATLKDMLNYGAAAQTYFGYKTDDLANSILSEADQAVPTVKMADSRVAGSNYYGTSLSLEENIVMNFYFKDASAVGTEATVTYTDYKGNEKEFKVTVVKTGSYAQVVVDTLTLSDAGVAVSVTVNGITTVDSVESYCARMAESLPLCHPLMQFAISARTHFTAN